jgi:hypothetical protein
MDPLVVLHDPPNEVQIAEFFSGVLQITEGATILAIIDQGLNTMAGFNDLKLEEITMVCLYIRRPGGSIEDDNGNLVPNCRGEW